MRKLRCAIYTRKSTEEGLDMAFNSLDAQREACEAYVRSQRAEGWLLLPTAYDDGGFSGGSMERPGLKRLLDDVRAGKVDTIVVYKVDRLTRSLSDFAKIVDVLDAADASFVSITQAFNTTTSMGRLTLNVLLSFAQFEREVIAERVRDKIAQSRAKGMWMGGSVPFGYDVVDRKLVPNETEASIVRTIFERYLELSSVRTLKAELDADGIMSKPAKGRDGVVRPRQFGRGPLYWLLGNPVYVGRVKHKDKLYAGEHQPIIPEPLWEAVQSKLADQAMRKANGFTSGQSSLLTGHVRDHHGRVMSPTRTGRGARMHRYYASVRGTNGSQMVPVVDKPVRAPAAPLEKAAVAAMRALFTPDAVMRRVVDMQNHGASVDLHASLERAAQLGKRLEFGTPEVHRELIDSLDLQLCISPDSISATISSSALGKMLFDIAGASDDGERIDLAIASERVIRPRSSQIVFPALASDAGQRDTALVDLMARAQRMRDLLLAGKVDSQKPHVRRMARLGWLAPDIVTAILEGRQPKVLTATRLFRMAGIPNDWEEQRRMLGFA
jgi:site-specific DNA recombinase